MRTPRFGSWEKVESFENIQEKRKVKESCAQPKSFYSMLQKQVAVSVSLLFSGVNEGYGVNNKKAAIIHM